MAVPCKPLCKPLAWMNEPSRVGRDRAGAHCEQVHHALIETGTLDLVHVQADEIRVKGRNMIAWMGLAMMVSTRLWLAGTVSLTREKGLADVLMQQVRRAALSLRPLLVLTDGWSAYPGSIRLICCVAFMIFQLFPNFIVSSFGSGDASYVSFAVRLLRIYMFSPFLNGLQPIIANFFTSIGKATKGIAVAITRQILFYCLQSLSCRYSLGLTELHMQGL